MIQRPPFREDADAYHEVGHAVVAQAVGFEVVSVDMHVVGTRRGICHYLLPVVPDPISEMTVAFASAPAEHLAGYLFEPKKVFGGDAKQAERLAREILGRRPTKRDRLRLFIAAMDQATAIVRDNWEAVVALARLLVREGAISGEVVRRTMKFYPPAKRRQKRVSPCHSSK